MTTFLFWNLNRRPLLALIEALVKEHEVDVLILAECTIPNEELLIALNRHGRPRFNFPFSKSEGIRIFTRFSGRFLKPLFESDRISIRHLSLPARADLLLVVAHLPSRLHTSESSLEFECVELAELVIDQERMMGHNRTVLVGDLNVNPFDKGVVAAKGLHAVMTRQLASKATRTILGREYRFFYNPMWGCFGDSSTGPPGTYYYEHAEQVCYFWNIFDQVMVRPELVERLESKNVRILTKAAGASLLARNGQPDSTHASDHLPIVFQLTMEEGV